jgi:hypothetical protein
MRKLKADPLAPVRTSAVLCARSRDERDAALKAAANTLAVLEAAVDSDSATDGLIEAVENEYEEKINQLVGLEAALKANLEAMIAVACSALGKPTPRAAQ